MEKGATHLFDTVTRFDHLYFSNIVRPSIVFEELGDLTTELKSLIEQVHIDRKSRFKPFESTLTNDWTLGVFELQEKVLPSDLTCLLGVSLIPHSREGIYQESCK